MNSHWLKKKRRSLFIATGLLAGSCQATMAAEDPVASPQAPSTAAPDNRPARFTAGFERVKLPASERMGLIGLGYLVELSPGWSLGPSVYGAASGERGGLFTWGLEGQHQWTPVPRWRVVTGLYVGGGGGASAPVGGGLMLRPHLDLMHDFDGWSVGLSVSHVRFPSGDIGSTQAGLQWSVNDRFLFTAPGWGGRRVASDAPGGLGFDRMILMGGRYATGPGLNSPLDHVGMRLERQLDDHWAATVDAAGAAAGGSDGYAEMAAGIQGLWPLGTPAFRVGGRVDVGLAGGGAVPTGGGTVGRAALMARLQLGRRVSLDLEGGRARAFDGDFNSNYARLGLGLALNDIAEAAAPQGSGLLRTVHDMQWEFSIQDYLRAKRKTGQTRSMSAVGLKFRRNVGESLYLTGQAHSAITGGAGAYSAGLVGVGVNGRIFGAESRWTAGAEALAGAAGGGGVNIRGGAIVQPMAWLGREVGTHSRVKLGGGWIRSVRDGLSSPVVDATWSWAFGVP